MVFPPDDGAGVCGGEGGACTPGAKERRGRGREMGVSSPALCLASVLFLCQALLGFYSMIVGELRCVCAGVVFERPWGLSCAFALSVSRVIGLRPGRCRL